MFPKEQGAWRLLDFFVVNAKPEIKVCLDSE